MKKIIKSPYKELGEVLPALLELVSINIKNRELQFKIYLENKETKDLKPYEKTRNLCFYLLKSYFKNIRPDLDNLDLFRVVLTFSDVSIFYKDKDTYSSINFTCESLSEEESYFNNLSNKEYEEYYINKLIDILQ